PRASYEEYVAREEHTLAGAAGEANWAYWSRQLDGDLPLLALPTDGDRPRVQTYRGRSERFEIGSELLQRLKSLSSARSATLFVTLLTAFQVLLSRYCGQDEILIGTPTSGRSSPDFAATVGYFVNPVVIRSVVRAADSFSDTVKRSRGIVIDAFHHQEYPFPDIVKRLNANRDPSRSPIFQAMFAFQKSHMDGSGALAAISLGDQDSTLQLGSLELRGFPLDQQVAQFDLTLTVAETAFDVKCAFEYNSDLFESATIQRMRTHFLALSNALVSKPSAPVSGASYISEVERNQLLCEWGDNSEDQYLFVPVHLEFERQVAHIPDSVAIVDGDSTLTYEVLDARANELCGRLKQLGAKPEVTIVLL
ncbi:MAG: condensation domain-containing protein, partial [Blastocatellia bacterium]